MKPGEAANQWAKNHPDYSGYLTVQCLTARGKAGRRGMKLTNYDYVVTGGKAAKKRTSNGLDNGVCDVTGTAYLDCVLDKYALPHPLNGQPIPRHYDSAQYGYGYFSTTQAKADEMGAIRYVYAYREGTDDEQHPDYRQRRSAWMAAKEITGDN